MAGEPLGPDHLDTTSNLVVRDLLRQGQVIDTVVNPKTRPHYKSGALLSFAALALSFAIGAFIFGLLAFWQLDENATPFMKPVIFICSLAAGLSVMLIDIGIDKARLFRDGGRGVLLRERALLIRAINDLEIDGYLSADFFDEEIKATAARQNV